MTWRALTPLGRTVLILAVLIVVAAVAHGLGLRWDPFGFSARRLRAAETRAEVAQDEAAARALEVAGAAAQADRLEAFHQQTTAVERATARTAALARTADDASSPLDPDRAARLVGHDRELCRLAPAVCGAAPADAADGGDDAVPAGSPA